MASHTSGAPQVATTGWKSCFSMVSLPSSNEEQTNRDGRDRTRADGHIRAAESAHRKPDPPGLFGTSTFGLITRRSRVRIPPPLFIKALVIRAKEEPRISGALVISGPGQTDVKRNEGAALGRPDCSVAETSSDPAASLRGGSDRSSSGLGLRMKALPRTRCLPDWQTS